MRKRVNDFAPMRSCLATTTPKTDPTNARLRSAVSYLSHRKLHRQDRKSPAELSNTCIRYRQLCVPWFLPEVPAWSTDRDNESFLENTQLLHALSEALVQDQRTQIMAGTYRLACTELCALEFLAAMRML